MTEPYKSIGTPEAGKCWMPGPHRPHQWQDEGDFGVHYCPGVAYQTDGGAKP